MSATAAARSIVRSASPRAAASLPSVAPKLRGCPKSTFCPFRSSKQTPVSLRISRSPVELSCSLETLLPYHTATASSLLTSKLSVSRIGYSWTLEGSYHGPH